SADKTAVVQTLGIARVIPVGSPVRGLAVLPAGTHVFTAADDKSVKMWNLSNGAMERQVAGMTTPVHSVTASKNNALVAAGAADGTVRVWNVADAKELAAVKAPAKVNALSFSPNNLFLAGACEDKSVLTWNVALPGGPTPPEFGRL